jgi:3-deoxy-manno-octulosonate cytidylyltransferase (CMP-KDO synthetase)
MRIIGIIPSRFASTRLPAKPLADIAGKSMIQRVYEQASQSKELAKVIVATDDARIFDHVTAFGGIAHMTSGNHVSGTDRCAEALTKEPEAYDYIINIQGDEPFVSPEQITALVRLLDGETELATLCKKINDGEMLFNPNVVKVVKSAGGQALYFSRMPIPHVRNIQESQWLKNASFYKHLGMYAYRVDVLSRITKLKPSTLELAESLEQLRWLEHGFRIRIAETTVESIGVDTPEDLRAAIELASRKG